MGACASISFNDHINMQIGFPDTVAEKQAVTGLDQSK
jgi:hypothetical protein